MTADLAEAPSALAALLAVAYLLIKHAVADFLLQTETQRHQKGLYGATGGIAHAATHIALTAPVFWLVPGASFAIAASLLLAEFVLHYHIDWAKEQLVRANNWTSADTSFWWAIGIDQMLHALTYVAIVAVGVAL